MNKKTVKLEKYIFKLIGNKTLFDFHIKRTIYYSKKLARIYNVNLDKAVAGVLLHDIDGIVAKTKNDFKNSQIIAEDILKRFNFDEDFIDEVKRVILTHSSGSKIKPRTSLEKIIANADAISHFEMIPLYYFYYKNNDRDFKEVNKSVFDKIEKSWNKLSLSEAKKIAKPLYLDAKKFLKLYKI